MDDRDLEDEAALAIIRFVCVVALAAGVFIFASVFVPRWLP